MVNSTLVTTMYVNPVTGNDTNAGSRLSPFKSLTHALKAVSSTTIIQLASGTYNQDNGELFPLVIPSGTLVVGNESHKGQEITISGGGDYQSPSFGTQNITLLLLGDASLLGVTVTNPTAKGTGVWIESGDPTLANNTLSGCGREGVFITGNAKPGIIDNLFVKNNVSGLMIVRNSRGEVLRNTLQNNSLGIAVSDDAAPLIASNKLSANGTAIALSRNAKPVLRRNLIIDNLQGGILVKGNAIPDLGNPQDPANNIFRGQGDFDLQNLTPAAIASVGNQINPNKVKGKVDLITQTTDSKIDKTTSFADIAIAGPYIIQPNPKSPAFSDLIGHWAEPFIRALIAQNLTDGFADGTYQPDEPINRAQYAALITTAFSPSAKRKPTEFTDIPPDFWAANAIQIAEQAGFVGGFSDRTFRPQKNVQRLQVIVSLVNGLGLSSQDNQAIAVYNDRKSIPEYAQKAVATATDHKIVVNYPDTKVLAPFKEATRGEVAAMVYQALVAIARAETINSSYIVLHISQ